MELTRGFAYFCDIHFKIMTDNIISGCNRFQKFHIGFGTLTLTYTYTNIR